MKSRMMLAVALTVLSTAALAQSNEEQQLCIDDAFRVCSATIPDRARTTACMIQNKSQLSAGCQAVMAKYTPGPTAPTATAPLRTVKNVSLKPVKTASETQRPGKPLNILMR